MLSCGAPCASSSVGSASQLFLTLIQTLSAAQCGISPPIMWPPDYGKVIKKKGLGEYDFIVVGSGSAGAIVASRLSEIKHWKVLLLEAGGDPPDESVVPGLYANMLKTPVDWGFYARSPNVCKIDGNKGCYTSRGKMLGGTSSFNGMLFIRGVPEDFDEWAAAGNEGWGYEDLLPYFKKYEGNENAAFVEYDNGRYHNANGPVKVQSVTPTPLDEIIMGAFKEAGAEFIDDINADKDLGYYSFQKTSSGGIRSSTAQAYLVPNMNRKNLHVIKHAYVNRILLDKNNVARGVEFTYKGKCKFIAKCTKEVIVSAGTIQSPTLLMRSGIGPRKHLKKHNIRCKANLAVGKNFRDHFSSLLIIQYDTPSEPAPSTTLLDSWYAYLTERSGPLAASFFFGGRIDTTNSTGLPDMQYDIGSIPRGTPSSIITASNLYCNIQSQNKLTISVNKNHALSYLLVNTIKPKSVGCIKLNDTLEADIYSGYLTNDEDRETLVRGIRVISNFLKTEPFQNLGAKFLRFPLEECDKLEYDSDDYWKCYIKYISTAGTHQVGTSKMGIDSESVVDPQLRVYKTTGLRQIDCGIMPDIIRANTNAAAMMIGEKGADLIKKTYL